MAAAAVTSSAEAPALTYLSSTTTTKTAAPAATKGPVAEAVRAIVAPPKGKHLGFDTNLYPGDKAMDAWKRSGEYDWVGYYLPAACHKDASWSGKRARLTKSGWGLAVIYVGQQTWGKSIPSTHSRKSTRSKKSRSAKGAHSMTRESNMPVATASDRCSATFVNTAQAKIDARDAINMASREGFEKGTVIFLDVEHMNSIPQAMRDYYTTWVEALLADGRYRPGIYAHTANAATIYDDANDVYARAGVKGDPPFWIAGTRGFNFKSSAPTDVGHAFASVWQGVIDVVRSHNGVKLPIDISVASVPSPSDAAVE